ncbi:DUF7601 domain-containing protein [Lentilactobacillus kisonensis]|uniref:DUF7601 domain-containing protein n=1 Tax=Lentilactobacillus kisonensis F0435 TaxID=797516 RepID=H1LBT0_9LACO|nr:DUF5979 domain-containing protein [Lentilactobacillus kisonensis]EHO54593.1 hypothetical protein HMPREF9104_00040 [Lentilactobacillus kisonensis F0435]
MKNVEDGKAVYVLQAVNPYPGNLIIKKTVESNGIDVSNETFKFDVKAVDDVEAPMTNFNASFDYSVYDKDGHPVKDNDNQPITGTVVFIEGVASGLPAIKDGQQIKITGLPQNQLFTITELGANKFITSNQLTNISSGSTQEKDGKATGQFTLRKGENAASTIAEFINRIEPGDFSFSKKIKGPNAANDGDKQFDFYLEAVDANGDRDQSFSGEINGLKRLESSEEKDVIFNFDKGIATTLKNGDKIQLRNNESYNDIKLPANMRFKVYERQDDTYKHTSYAIDGEIKDEAASESDGEVDYHVVGPMYTNGKHLKFTNEQKENSFEFEKIVSGKESTDKFKFEVKGGNETTIDAIAGKAYAASLVNARTGNVINDYEIQFNAKGEATEWYTDKNDPATKTDIALMHEQKVVITGLPIETTQFEVTELVAETDWNIQHQIDGDVERDGNVATLNLNRGNGRNSIMFRNLEPEMVSFKVKKTVSGVVPPKDSDFKFNLTINNPKENWEEKKAFRAVKSGDMKEFDLIFTRSADRKTYTVSETLKADESLTIFTLKGLKVNVEEENHQGYDVSYQYGDHRDDGYAYEITTGDGDCGQACLPPLIFNNHVPGTAVEIEKKVKGTDDYNKTFNFNVTVKDQNNELVSANVQYKLERTDGQISTGSIKFERGIITEVDGKKKSRLQIKNDEKLTILGLPAGTNVVVAETNAFGYNPSYILNHGSEKPGNKAESFETSEDKTSNVKFINTKKDASLKISKSLEGAGIKEGDKATDFEFKISATAVTGNGLLNGEFDAWKYTNKGAAKVKVTFNKGAANITLKADESINLIGLSDEYSYRVQELTPDGFEYDPSYKVNGGSETIGNSTGELTIPHSHSATVDFINTREGASLEISKLLDGNGILESDRETKFNFRILSDVKGTYDYVKFDTMGGRSEGEISFNGTRSDQIQLKDNERISIHGLPLESTYVVKEDGATEFKTHFKVNGTGLHEGKQTGDVKLAKDEKSTILFTNSKQAPETASLKITKRLAGTGLTDADKTRSFNFRIYSGATGTFDTVKTSQNGSTTESEIKFNDGQSDLITLRDTESLDITGLPVDQMYRVGEEFVTDFTPSFKVNGRAETNRMTTDSFQLIANQNGTVDFTNTKNGDVAMGSFSVNKFVNAIGDKTRAFEFNLEAVDGAGNPLNGIFQTESTTNSKTAVTGRINIQGGNAKFTLTHGQSIKFILPMGARYEVSEKDYKVDGYTTRVTKRDAAYTGTHVFGTATADSEQH